MRKTPSGEAKKSRIFDDPRLTKRILRLPRYRRARQRWQGDPRLATSLIFLGIKLADADSYRARLIRRVAQSNPPVARSKGLASGATRWRAFSREADAFIFAVYGALDALAQVAVRVAGVQTEEEVKFPALARLLARESRHPERRQRLRGWLEEVYQARWFKDLRRLRNLVNYRSVFSFPMEGEEGLNWSATYGPVVESVEAGLELLLEPAGT